MKVAIWSQKIWISLNLINDLKSDNYKIARVLLIWGNGVMAFPVPTVSRFPAPVR